MKILLLALLLSAPAMAGETALLVFGDSTCGSVVSIIPMNAANISCDSIPNSGNYARSFRLQGDNTCVANGDRYITVASVCKAYNGK